jgi:ureidoacrylate peracid hydrolase
VKTLPQLRKEDTALLIIDMQNDFVKPEGYFGKRGKNVKPVLDIIPNIAYLLEFCRRNNIFRIFVRTIHAEYTNSYVWASRYRTSEAPPLCLPNSWGAEIIDELRPRDDECIVTKHRYSAMLDTDLPLILRSKRITTLLITGTATNVCVDSTVRHAFMMDFTTITLRDCVATTDVELHEPTLWNLEQYFGYVADSKDILKMLSEQK